MTSYETAVRELLERADIKVNGSRPWDIKVLDDRLYKRILSQGSLGFGEAYMEGWWNCDHLDQMIFKVLKADLKKEIAHNPKFLLYALRAVTTNMASKSRAFKVGEQHYDIGNDLYERMLDKRLTYTCGYWKNATTLDEAQEAKLDLVCRKIGLKHGQKILDIGCGWGSFAKFAAQKYGAHVVGITISREQVRLANELCKGLPVEIRLQDYRDMENEKFDHIISLGMVEHVGYKNYRTFMKVVANSLKDNGLFLLHTIGSNRSVKTTDPWIEKYIFPNSMIPSLKQLAQASEKILEPEDMHNFGVYYDKTLLEWYNNFDMHWPEIKDHYSERFYRMWKFYLLSCAGSFRARHVNLWQIVFSKHGLLGGYNSIR